MQRKKKSDVVPPSKDVHEDDNGGEGQPKYLFFSFYIDVWC